MHFENGLGDCSYLLLQAVLEDKLIIQRSINKFRPFIIDMPSLVDSTLQFPKLVLFSRKINQFTFLSFFLFKR